LIELFSRNTIPFIAMRAMNNHLGSSIWQFRELVT